jgi:hypothetical protein
MYATLRNYSEAYQCTLQFIGSDVVPFNSIDDGKRQIDAAQKKLEAAYEMVSGHLKKFEETMPEASQEGIPDPLIFKDKITGEICTDLSDLSFLLSCKSVVRTKEIADRFFTSQGHLLDDYESSIENQNQRTLSSYWKAFVSLIDSYEVHDFEKESEIYYLLSSFLSPIFASDKVFYLFIRCICPSIVGASVISILYGKPLIQCFYRKYLSSHTSSKGYQEFLSSLKEIKDDSCKTDEDHKVVNKIETLIKTAFKDVPKECFPKVKTHEEKFSYFPDENEVMIPMDIFPSHRFYRDWKGVDFEALIAHELGHSHRAFELTLQYAILHITKTAMAILFSWPYFLTGLIFCKLLTMYLNHREEYLADEYAASLIGKNRTIEMIRSLSWNGTHKLYHKIIQDNNLDSSTSFSHPSHRNREQRIQMLPDKNPPMISSNGEK